MSTMTRTRISPSVVALWCLLVAALGPVVTLKAQAPSLRVSTPALQSEISRVTRASIASTHERAARRGMSPTTKGAVIGGGIGLGVSVLLTLLYIESTDSGNDSGAGRAIVIGTALGAVIGAAIGAGRN